jgi:hypothetical protein
MKTTINKEQELYIIHSKKWCSCLGFDVLLRRLKALSDELGIPCAGYERGSMEAYEQYERVVEVARIKHKSTGWRSKSELTPELIPYEGKRVEVAHQYGDDPPQKVRFQVGKSTGFIPIHLALSRKDSSGGDAVCLGVILSVRRV